jgi:rhodanese-related sulfurtransferase
VHVPYHDLRDVPGELDRERPIAVICSSGQRSSVGASLLQRFGVERPVHVVGNVRTWLEADGS